MTHAIKFNVLILYLIINTSNVLSQLFLSLPARNVPLKKVHSSIFYNYSPRVYKNNQTYFGSYSNSSKQFGVSGYTGIQNSLVPVAQNNFIGIDVDPILLNNAPGSPGIKVRINNCAFTYFSKIITPILTQQLKNARLPNINQCLPPPLQGCIQVYNLYVSRFRCPNRVILYPAPPNQIVIAIENFDIGVTGNLGGVINILLPVALTGIIQVNAHQVSIIVSLIIERNFNGGISIRVGNCQTKVGYLDAYIENGGLLGDIANSQFRSKISEMIRSMLPTQVCNQIPSIVNQRLNEKLTTIPQSIALSQILQVALSSFGLENVIGRNCPAQSKKLLNLAAAPHLSSQVALTPPTNLNYTFLNNNIRQKSIVHINVDVKPYKQTINNSNQKIFKNFTNLKSVVFLNETSKEPFLKNLNQIKKNQENVAAQNLTQNFVSNRLFFVQPYISQINVTKKNNSMSEFVHRTKRQYFQYHVHGVAVMPSSRTNNRFQSNQAKTYINPVQNAPNPSGPGLPSGKLAFAEPGSNTCGACGNSGTCDSTDELISLLLQSLDFNKLSNIYLKIQLLQTYATNQDFTIELNGEFYSPNQNNVPFAAFPMRFSQQFQSKMAEILISDWTINTLFYHLQKVNFITIRIGPETPKIGELLKTTCSSDEELEDHGVETDELNTSTLESDAIAFKNIRRKLRNTINSTLGNEQYVLHRKKREESLADLGICLGDLLPNIRDKYPNKKIYIQITSQQAPTVILSESNGGTATLKINLKADFIIQETNEKVGGIQIISTIDFTIITTEGKISAHVDLKHLQLLDPGETLGLSQEALDNLGNLSKELLLKAGNNALEKGVSPNFSGVPGLPIKFSNLELRIVEHAVHLASDFTIDPSVLTQLGGGGSGSC